ncbi:MAG: class II fumarate hydratase [Candidatus Heimdallarchaeota archaeon]
MTEYRIETDSLGEVKVPKEVYWGAQTQRSLKNFAISGIQFPKLFLEALIRIKRACAKVNSELGEIPSGIAMAIIKAANKIFKDDLWNQFPLDIMQTGSGTHTNMNANEVLANIASELLDSERGKKHPVHPNDHVNRGQSSNDIISVAMNVSIAVALKTMLFPVLNKIAKSLDVKAKEFENIIKVARTHLQDAVPITLGQEFSGYSTQIKAIEHQLMTLFPIVCKLPVGGTAVGTGLNAHPKLAPKVCKRLSEELDLNFTPSTNRFAQIAAHDELVTISGLLKTLAVALLKIANDLRFLASGPRCGLGEISLPVNEPGSSMMPGKVNPTQAEALIQCCLKVIGNDYTMTMCGFYGGQLDLNTAKPLMIYCLLESIIILSHSMNSFTDRCLVGITANREHITTVVEKSLQLITALTPHIGYDNAVNLVQQAIKEEKTIREVALENKILDPKALEKVLDLSKMVRPHKE